MDGKKETNRLSPLGVAMLIVAILIFSGAFTNAQGPLKVLDFSNLLGSFGKIADNLDFRGKGGDSAREGFMFALTLAPTVMVAMGLIQIFENFGALKAAEKLLTPIMKPIMGVPGQASLALVGSLSSSDAGSAMTRELYESGRITEDERDVFTAFQYSSSGIIVNYFGGASSIFGSITVGAGIPFVYLFVIKIIEANLMRLIIRLERKKGGKTQMKEEGEHGTGYS